MSEERGLRHVEFVGCCVIHYNSNIDLGGNGPFHDVLSSQLSGPISLLIISKV